MFVAALLIPPLPPPSTIVQPTYGLVHTLHSLSLESPHRKSVCGLYVRSARSGGLVESIWTAEASWKSSSARMGDTLSTFRPTNSSTASSLPAQSYHNSEYKVQQKGLRLLLSPLLTLLLSPRILRCWRNPSTERWINHVDVVFTDIRMAFLENFYDTRKPPRTSNVQRDIFFRIRSISDPW